MEIYSNKKRIIYGPNGNTVYDSRKDSTGFKEYEFTKPEELKEIVKYDWTPNQFTNGDRKNINFLSTDFLYADIDNDSEDKSIHCSIEQFEAIFVDKEYFLITSRNHQKEKKKSKGSVVWISKPCDRFHVLFPLNTTCIDGKLIESELNKLVKTYNFFDPSVHDLARFFFGYEETEIIYHNGIKWKLDEIEVEKDFDYTNEIKDFSDTNDNIKKYLTLGYNQGIYNDREKWIDCGLALKANGFTIDDWKLITHSNEKEKDIINRWNGFKPNNLTFGSLVYFCQLAYPDFLKPGWRSRAGITVNPISQKPPAQMSSTVVARNENIKYLSKYDKMNIDDFPNYGQIRRMIPGTTNQYEWVRVVKPTLKNFEVMLEKYGIIARYNLMAHRPEIVVPGINGEGNNQNASVGIIASLIKLNNIDCIGVMNDYIQAVTNNNKYHPVKDWINEGYETWDGIDRFKELINSIDIGDGLSNDKFELYFRKWLLSCYACLFCENYRGRGVLTFQGRQYQGKSAFFKVLLKKGEEREWFTEGLTLDPKNKDSVALAISHWISELGELEGTFKRSDISSLKSFLTKETDVIRMPYDKREEMYPRRSVFCASVNDSLFLADDTGSSRFWVVPIKFVHLDRLESFNAKQLWLQVKEWYKTGEKWWMTQEEDFELQVSNEDFTEKDPYEDVIMGLYHIEDRRMNEDNLRHLTVSQIAKEVGINIISKSITNGLARTLRRMNFVYKKTNTISGFLMPRLYSESEKDYMKISHVFTDGKGINDEAV